MELVERAKEDPQAFGAVYELHYSAILNYLLRRTLDIGLAEELSSETFFKALKGLLKFRNKVPVRAWLYRIASNELKMHWRKGKSHQERDKGLKHAIESERIGCTHPEAADDEELRERLARHASLLDAMDGLAPRYREALTLRYFEGLKYDEIAIVLNKRPGTVKSLVHRGLVTLRKTMGGPNATF